MNKKIISIFFLLLIFISITLVYYYTNNEGEVRYENHFETIYDTNISEEIDETFIEEDAEIEIGEMV